MADIAAIAARYEALKTLLDERSRRLLAAAESQAVGKGGISVVAKATGISRSVIRQGIADLKDPTALASGRVRKEGGGRKRVIPTSSSPGTIGRFRKARRRNWKPEIQDDASARSRAAFRRRKARNPE